MKIKDDIVWRLAVVYVLALLVGVFIVFKVFYLQFWEGEKWKAAAGQLKPEDIILEPIRGDIIADDGRILATSLPFYEIRMDLKSEAMSDDIFFNNVDSLATCLSAMFRDKTKLQYKDGLIQAHKKGERAYLITNEANYLQFKRIKQFPIFNKGRYKGGFTYIQHNRRKHPYGELALRTIGRLQNKAETNITVGIEGAYNYLLKGVSGIKLSGDFWDIIEDDEAELHPQDGKDVITTIDVDMQDVAENALLRQLIKHEAHHGSVILMEVQTGEVKAIANLTKNSDGTYSETYNYAVGESSEPGSTFKLMSLVAALEDGYVDLNDKVNTMNGEVRYYGFLVREAKPGGFGLISIKRAFELSSNVGISQVIFNNYKSNPKRFVDRLYSMNLNKELGIELIGEGKPYIKYPGDPLWSNISLPQMAIGYEVRITPLQTLAFYNAIANDGVLLKPKFVKALSFHGTVIKTFEPEIINNSICSHNTIQQVKKMLEGVVNSGTAVGLSNPTYKIAGKTGTAKIYDGKVGEYVNRYKASFVGYFPADKPRYSCIVMIVDPAVNGYFGSTAAAPVFREISDWVYINDLDIHQEINPADKPKKNILAANTPYVKDGYKDDIETALEQLNINSKKSNTLSSKWIVASEKTNYVQFDNRALKENIAPKVIGMGLRDAMYVLEVIGLSVEVRGRGKVVRQSINAGTPVKNGEKIIIELS